MDIRRVARGAAWTVAAGAMLVVGLYLVLVAINWRDESPSADALRLQRIIEDRTVVSDSENSFVYLLGLGVPRDQDPFAWGVRRRAFLDAFPTADASTEWAALPGTDHDFSVSRATAITTLIEACREGGNDCWSQLQDHPDQVDEWSASEGWLLERYLKLIHLTQWRESIPADVRAPFPSYRSALDGQWLLFMDAWRHARHGDALAARELLQQDQAFWRMVLRSSDILISRIIAAVAIERNFLLGNLVLRQLHMVGSDATAPASWSIPLERGDWSMARTFAGEWRFSQGALDSPMQSFQVQEEGVASRFVGWTMRPMLKKQATGNLLAANMVRLIDGLDVDISELPGAIDALGRPWRSGMPLYNPVGEILGRIGYSNYAPYAARVGDLEGTRRAVLLAAELRSQHCHCASGMSRLVADSALRNPYSNAPFAWEEDGRSIVFLGAATPRGRHVVPL